MRTASLGGAKYFLLLIDDFTRKAFVYFLKSKGGAFDKFRVFKVMAENQQSRQIKIFRSDNGGELSSAEFKSFLSTHGILRQTSAPRTPQQNGLVERYNRTILEMARCMLYSRSIDVRFWAEAVNTAVYVKNRAPHSKMAESPEQLWTGKQPSLKHLRVFGCVAYVHIHDNLRTKLEPKSIRRIFIGYADGMNQLLGCSQAENHP